MIRSAASRSIRDIVQMTVYSARDCAVMRPSSSVSRCSTVGLSATSCPVIQPANYKTNFARHQIGIADSPQISTRVHKNLRPFLTNKSTFTDRSTGRRSA